MNINQILDFIAKNYGMVLTIAGALGISLEISPAKCRPVSWLLKKIGKIMLGDIEKKVSKLDEDFSVFRKNYDLEQISRIRKEISDFVISLQRTEKHTKKDFERINNRIVEYHNLLDKHGLENSNIDIETKYINDVYLECLKDQKFFDGKVVK